MSNFESISRCQKYSQESEKREILLKREQLKKKNNGKSQSYFFLYVDDWELPMNIEKSYG